MTDYREQTGKIFPSLRNAGLRSKFVASFVLTMLVSTAVFFSTTIAVSANDEFVFGLKTNETEQHQQEVFSDSRFATDTSDELTEAQIVELEAQIIELQLEVIRLLELIVQDLEEQVYQQRSQTQVTTPPTTPVATPPTTPVAEVPPVTGSEDPDELDPNDDQTSDPADPDEEDQDESPADDEDVEKEIRTNALAAFFGVPPERSSLFTALFFLILIAGAFFIHRSWGRGAKADLPIIMGGASDRNQTGSSSNPTNDNKNKTDNKDNSFNKDRRDDRQNKSSSR